MAKAKNLIDSIAKDAYEGKVLSRDGMLELLALDPDGEDALYLRSVANEMAHRVSGGRGYIWGAIGLDFVPCEMNCAFCSFSSKYSITTEPHVLSDEEILRKAHEYAEAGVDFLTLRSTEFFDVEKLAQLARMIRKEVPGDYVIYVNTGELDVEKATFLHDNGVYGAYHAYRVREGIDTPFNPQVRLDTLRSIAASPLMLASCLEPIGPEHTDEELADVMRIIATVGVNKTGVMSRSPVKGTVFEDVPLLEGTRLYQIVAILRLAVSAKVDIVSCYPLRDESFTSGANQISLETGAIPRDSQMSEGNWRKLRFEDAKGYLRRAGFTPACDK